MAFADHGEAQGATEANYGTGSVTGLPGFDREVGTARGRLRGGADGEPWPRRCSLMMHLPLEGAY